MTRLQFAENQIYHIYNRGVEKRDIFMDDIDYYRFIHDLFEFNDENSVYNINYYLNKKSMEIGSPYLGRKPRKLLVEILIFTLMPNHFHLLLRQKQEGGIAKFMQKMGIGYTMYFNQKYERSGVLFQGKFKSVLVNKESHFIHLPYYIHLNPLKLLNYRDPISIDSKKAMEFLENYKWSSFPDYISKRNFPSITQRDFFLDFFGGGNKYKEGITEWLAQEKENIKRIDDIVLE